ncbi:hypothetical protein LIA77_05978 [Sarocladium implicatum]|nr:hypothetical protein LIA77_05978 [Sarocladium implicatum]
MRFFAVLSTLAAVAIAAPQLDGPGVPDLKGKFDLRCGSECHAAENSTFILNDHNRFLFDPEIPNGHCVKMYGQYEKCWLDGGAVCDGGKCAKVVLYVDENCWEESRPEAELIVGQSQTCVGPTSAKYQSVRVFPVIMG